MFQADCSEILNRGLPVKFGKSVNEVVFVQMCHFCKIVQGNIVLIMGVNVPFDAAAFPGGVFYRNQFKGRICLAHQKKG